ncbi:MAG: DUF3833 domain-containing protein [Candidatus Protistobacter heckmanni]|nr:DUF3833 domain-containing protein [Candidatus Protistobacter heckmanni]
MLNIPILLGAPGRRAAHARLAGLAMAAALGAAGALTGCAEVVPAQYTRAQPTLDPRMFFNGTVDAWGVFTDRKGLVTKRFTAVFRCEWKTVDGVETGTLDEEFKYSDDTRQRRVWTLRKTGEGLLTGSASDVVGEAAGSYAGNALNWKYTLAITVDDQIYHVQFDDWMYQMDNQTMLSRATMNKLGMRLGDLTMSMRRRRD